MKAPYKIGTKSPLLKVLLYGDPGVGKTMLAATAQEHADMADVLFLNADRGVDTVQGSGALAVDIGAETGNMYKDAEEAVWAVIQKKPGFETVKTVVFDNSTEFQGQDLMDIVTENKKKKPGRSIDEVGRDDYGKSTTRMLRVLRLLRDAPVNVIITAWTKRVQAEGASAPTEVGPSLTQQASQVTQGLVSCVWYMYIDDKGIRTLLTQPTGVFKAKTRIPKFAESIGSIVKEPNLAKIYNQLLQSSSAGTAKVA